LSPGKKLLLLESLTHWLEEENTDVSSHGRTKHRAKMLARFRAAEEGALERGKNRGSGVSGNSAFSSELVVACLHGNNQSGEGGATGSL